MKTSKECTTCRNLSDTDSLKCLLPTKCYSPNYNNWKPIETKKMKSTSKRIIEVLKEMFTFSDSVNLFAARITSLIAIPYLCFIAISAVGSEITTSHYTFGGMVTGLLMTIGIWFLGYFSRKPDPQRKGFKKWLKICKLNVQIAILKKNLKPYHTLNKIKHQKYKSTRELVKEWRLKLNQLKRELKELI